MGNQPVGRVFTGNDEGVGDFGKDVVEQEFNGLQVFVYAQVAVI